MQEIATKYYTYLLTIDSTTPEICHQRLHVWDNITPKVIPDVIVQLSKPFPHEEMCESLKSLLHTRCPGLDGLTPLFFM